MIDRQFNIFWSTIFSTDFNKNVMPSFLTTVMKCETGLDPFSVVLLFSITIYCLALCCWFSKLFDQPSTERLLQRSVWSICTSITRCFWNFRDAGARLTVYRWCRHHCCLGYGQRSRGDSAQRPEHCLLGHWTRFENKIQPLLFPERKNLYYNCIF